MNIQHSCNKQSHFRTIYDLISYIDSIPTFDSEQYSADTTATAYRIPFAVWLKTTQIDENQIRDINKNLVNGEISLFQNTVYLMY